MVTGRPLVTGPIEGFCDRIWRFPKYSLAIFRHSVQTMCLRKTSNRKFLWGRAVAPSLLAVTAMGREVIP